MKGRRNLEVGGLVARPHGKTRGLVAVEVGDGQVELPIVLLCGTADGPRVAVTAGIHGGEYVSIPALRQVIEALDPADVSGSIVAVLDANPRAFFSRSVYTTPPDGKNINRVFPGDPGGSPTERLASWLFEQVIAPSERFIDMHSGDLNEELVPFVGITAPIELSVDSVADAMANEYGLGYVIGGGMAAGTAVGAARAAHIPAIWSEVGGRGSWSPAEVGMHVAGLRRALKAAGVYRGPTEPAVQVPRRLRQNAWLRSEVRGSLYLDVAVGDMVEDGQSLGEIRDFFGEPLQPVRATMSGLVFFVVTSLAIERGDPILGLGA